MALGRVVDPPQVKVWHLWTMFTSYSQFSLLPAHYPLCTQVQVMVLKRSSFIALKAPVSSVCPRPQPQRLLPLPDTLQPRCLLSASPRRPSLACLGVSAPICSAMPCSSCQFQPATLRSLRCTVGTGYEGAGTALPGPKLLVLGPSVPTGS